MKKWALLAILSLAALSVVVPDNLPANGPDNETRGKTFLVKDPQGRVLGTASQVLENSLGNPDFVIVSLDREKFHRSEILVPFSSISRDTARSIVVNLPPDVLAQAPAFKSSVLDDVRSLDNIYEFYGMTPPWSEEGAK